MPHNDRKHINPRRPIPNDSYSRLRTNLEANFRDSFPSIDGGFPGPDTRPNISRGAQISRKDDLVRDISIGLQDHDGNQSKKMDTIEIKKVKFKHPLLCLKGIVLKKEEILVTN